MKTQQQSILQIIWGTLLLLAGLALFVRIPQVLSDIQQIDAYSSDIPFKRFSLYLIGSLLAGGGLKKIWINTKSMIQGRKNNS